MYFQSFFQLMSSVMALAGLTLQSQRQSFKNTIYSFVFLIAWGHRGVALLPMCVLCVMLLNG